MKILISLGNPGKEYERTRHNAGFLAVDWIVSELGLKIANFRLNKKFNSEILEIKSPLLNPPPQGEEKSDIPLPGWEGLGKGERVIFVKPQTFMNNSGLAVKGICGFYKIDPTHELCVIHDDVDLPMGVIRTADNSSSAGHKGVQSIIDRLGTQEFYRLRLGIESRQDKSPIETEAYVLQNFTAGELETLNKDVFPKVVEEIGKFLKK